MIDEAKDLIPDYGTKIDIGMWEHIRDVHDGRLPVRIRTVPEGTILRPNNVMFDIENTDVRCESLPGHLEDILIRGFFYGPTIAARDLKIYKTCRKYLEETADPEALAGLPYMLNDFGLRGVSSYESAQIGGLAHLCIFRGTDNTPAVKYARDVYGFKGAAGNTIPAAEHSTITAWGRTGEVNAYANMVEKFGSGGIMAVVSDSYNIYKAVEEMWCGVLLEQVKKSGARVVIRPDSGDATRVPIELMKIIVDKCGFTLNGKGYKVLPNYFRIIQGDGIDEDMIEVILENMKQAGFSAENIVFGMGGGMLQKLDRDTLKFAMKCSATCDANGVWTDVYKDPIDDKGKTSLKGRLELVARGGKFFTIRADEYRFAVDDMLALETVFEDGVATKVYSLEEVRARIEKQLA